MRRPGATWRDLARDTQAALTQYANDQGIARHEAEADVKAKARTGAKHNPNRNPPVCAERGLPN